MSSIDVVIPCYRYGRYLRQCVASVLSQGIGDCRVLILDDESPDDTPQVARALVAEDARVTYRRHAANQGHIATYNEGIEWCAADYMLLLSADDYLLPGAFARAFELLDAHPAIGLCFGEAIEADEQGTQRRMSVAANFRGGASTVVSGAEFIRLCADAGSNNIVPTPTAIVRTRLLAALGGYRSDLPHSADMELWLRLAAHGQVGIVKADLAVYRRHAGNMSTAYYEDNRMADLQQRRAAFDGFLASCSAALPDAVERHRSLMQGLSREAVVQASGAFNDNRLALSRRLCDFALELSPDVRKRLEWKMLACKRLLGFHAATALRPVIAQLRATRAKAPQAADALRAE